VKELEQLDKVIWQKAASQTCHPLRLWMNSSNLAPSKTGFLVLGATWVSSPSSTSIGSAVFAGLMNVTNRQTDHATLCVAVGWSLDCYAAKKSFSNWKVMDKSTAAALWLTTANSAFLCHPAEQKSKDVQVADADADRLQHIIMNGEHSPSQQWHWCKYLLWQYWLQSLQCHRLDVSATTKLLYRQSIFLQSMAAAGPALCSNFLGLSAYRCLRQKILKTISCARFKLPIQISANASHIFFCECYNRKNSCKLNCKSSGKNPVIKQTYITVYIGPNICRHVPVPSTNSS